MRAPGAALELLRRRAAPGFLLLAAALVFPLVPAGRAGSAATGGPPAPARVRLDRLTWAPDGNALAVEAVLEEAGGSSADTLLVDLARGGLAVRNPFPLRLAFDSSRGRLAAATRHAILAGPAAHPESAAVVARRDPTSAAVERLAFAAGGDSLLVMTRPFDGAWFDIFALDLSRGREKLLYRVTRRREADSLWECRAGGAEATAIVPTPFPALYVPVRGALLSIERSEAEVPGVRGAWLYDLYHRVPGSGDEKLLARHLAPWASALSPDSAWLAVAGTVARPDYGGGMWRALWLLSTDGLSFFSVKAEGVRDDRPLPATAMGWCDGALWYTTPEGLHRLDPARGRSRPVRLGPPPPAWSDSLAPPARIWTLAFPERFPDSTGAVLRRERLRRDGWPAWVMGPPGGPFRTAIGSETDSDRLEPLAVRLEEAGVSGFVVEQVVAVAAGDPFPHAVTRSPVGGREAWLCAVGPAGFPAGELRLAEQHGARQIKLIGAMLRVGPR